MDAYTSEFREWFWSQVEVLAQESRCWLWAGEYDHENDRGVVIDPATGKAMNVSRMAWILVNGPVPENTEPIIRRDADSESDDDGDDDRELIRLLWILHRCDLAICCNPNHLYAGTPKQNAQDRKDRGLSPHTLPQARRKVSDPATWVRECIESAIVSS